MKKKSGFLALSIIVLLILPVAVSADSPGVIAGYSNRDQQTMGGTNNRCAVDALSGGHVSWTEGGLSDRIVNYNFIDENGDPAFDDGTQVNPIYGGGFPSVVVNSQNAAGVAYHNFSNLNVTLGVDGARGIGLFTIYDPPDGMPGISYTFWPQMAIDYTGEYHILSVEHGMGDIAVPMIYTHSQNNLESWESPQYVDTIGIQAYLVAASKFDSRVAVVYAKPRQNFDADFYNNDVVYIESPNGIDWDFEDKINITNYLDEDSIRCFNSLDAVYDPEGNLHIVWVTPFYNQNTFWASVDSCLLWHWSEETGTGLITDGLNLSNPGTWNKSISSCNISVDDVGTLYVTYCRFFDDDVSHGGFSNGEIYYTFSIDNGDFWFPDENITNSESNGCMPGDCDNDMQLSAADYVDNSLYLFYINDKDAGMFSSEEGSETSNPQMYFRYPLAVDVDEDGNPFVPGSFYLAPAYPNPFNANTTLSYDIENEGNVKLEIYNVAGQKVSTLVDDLHQPGHYTVNFDADNLSSGVYYARLISSENRMVRKLALLK